MPQIQSVSVVIPVNERGEGLISVLQKYISTLSSMDLDVEYIVILTPQYEHLTDAIKQLSSNAVKIQTVLLNKNYGEAGEIKIGVGYASFKYILTLPAYEQIDPSHIPKIFDQIDGNDMVVVNRWPRIDAKINKVQSFLFRGLMKMLSQDVQKDPGCSLRLVKKEVFDDIRLYGDLHRFTLTLANQMGFKTKEIDFPQSPLDSHHRVYNFSVYLARMLDILTIGFISRFNKKPLRFFGAGGAISAFIGLAGFAYLLIEHIVFSSGLGDRPLLLLFSLFLVLGVQLIAIGLIGETIIFTSSKDQKEYKIRKIIN